MKCTGGSTSGLQKHLKNVHQISMNTADSQVPQSVESPSTSTNTEIKPKKKAKLTDYYESDANPSMEIMVSRMSAMDGYPFRTFVESEDLRMLFRKSGHKLPKATNSIQNIVIKQADKRKQQLIGEIQKLLTEGHTFSISFDEWTSIRNRRYISLNLQTQRFPENFKNLGLIRAHGSLSAKRCIDSRKRYRSSNSRRMQYDY